MKKIGIVILLVVLSANLIAVKITDKLWLKAVELKSKSLYISYKNST